MLAVIIQPITSQFQFEGCLKGVEPILPASQAGVHSEYTTDTISRETLAESQTQVISFRFRYLLLDSQHVTVEQPDQDLNLEHLVRSEG
jgi:hypothetical protein